MTISDTSLLSGVAALLFCLGTGVWIGFRFARESTKMTAIINRAADTGDDDWETEMWWKVNG